MKPSITIAFWGKEPSDLFGYDRILYKNMRRSVQDLIEHMTLDRSRHVKVLVNGAQGAGQIAFWAAEAAKRRGCPVSTELIQPWEGWDQGWAEDSAFGRNEYRSILSKASTVVNVGEPVSETEKVALIRQSYEKLVNFSELQFVFFRSSLNPHIGGKTLRAVEYAKTHGKTPLVFDLDLSND